MLCRSLATAGLLVLPTLTVGCDLIEPCNLTEKQRVENALDRTWRISTVNGVPVPAAGVQIPGSSDRLLLGTLNFRTQQYSGNCEFDDEGFDENVKDEGRVVAVYTIVNSAGQAKPSQTYAGWFKYVHVSGVVTLKADTASIEGKRVVNDMTFSGTIPLFGQSTVKFLKAN